jgi:hypothetical protein
MKEIRGGRCVNEAGFSPNLSDFLLLIIRRHIVMCRGGIRRGLGSDVWIY